MTDTYDDENELDYEIVFLESPYAGDVESNIAYARRACKDCMKRKEVPLASHLIFTQFLDDNNSEERQLGIEIGYWFWDLLEGTKIVFYLDLGWSPGMLAAKARADEYGYRYEIRYMDEHEE